MNFKYSINKELLPQVLQEVVVECGPDPELSEFIEHAKKNPYSKFRLFFYKVLSPIIPLYDIDAMLGIYPLYLLSKTMWKKIIPNELQDGKLLDVGAGQGFVTLNAKPLFKEIVTTETSFAVAMRLRAKGFKCVHKDIAKYPNIFKKAEFDVAALLDVLDRSDFPLSLLKNALNFLKDDGVIIISIPVPISPAFFGVTIRDPKEMIIKEQNANFEECVTEFYEKVLKPHNLVPSLLTRLPYVCPNDKPGEFTTLDNFLVVCKKDILKQRKVLFVCLGNIARSQFAEEFLKKTHPEYLVTSAGTRVRAKDGTSRDGQKIKEVGEVALNTIEVMKEIGINFEDKICTQLKEEIANDSDVVIVMAEKETWPEYLKNSNKVVFWDVLDPGLTDLDFHRNIRDEVKAKVEEMFK